jgi:hypothetical protein
MVTMGRRLELKGKRCGMYTVIEFVEVDRHHQTMWLCDCNCGRRRVMCTNVLLDPKQRRMCDCQKVPKRTAGRQYRWYDDLIEIGGVNRTIREWIRINKLEIAIVRARIRGGMDVVEAVTRKARYHT